MYKIPLSPYHKIFYNEWKLHPESSKYNIVFDQTLSSHLDISRLKSALKRFISDHLILNSHVSNINEKLYWVANSQIPVLEHLTDSDTPDQILKYVSKPFNLERDPLCRFALFEEANGANRFILVFHHIVFDGNSFAELVDTISYYYNDISYKIKKSLNEQVKLHKINAKLLHEKLKKTINGEKDFWGNILYGMEPINLKFLKSTVFNGSSTRINKEEIRFEFSQNILNRVKQLKHEYNLTPYAYGKLIFAILINRYTSQENFTISYSVAIKEYIGLLYGAGVNSNIYPCYFNKDTTLVNLITQHQEFISQVKNEEFNYSYYPIDQLIAKGNKRMLDVFFIKTDLKDYEFKFNNIKILSLNREFNLDVPTKLLFEQERQQGCLNYRVRYDSNQIDKTILKQFISYYKSLFVEILFDLEKKLVNKAIAEYPILSIKEYQKIVYEWNNTDRFYQKDKTIHELFEEQVKLTPNSIAVIYKGKKLTYHDLNIKANHLAYYLKIKHSIKQDNLIALYMDRSENIIVGMLAILKAGGAYVFISPSNTEKRITLLLETSCPEIIISNLCHKLTLENCICKNNFIAELVNKIIFIDHDISIDIMNSDNFDSEALPSSLAYIAYTSGTTGVPKGVMVEHRNVVSLVNNVDYVKITTSDRMIQLADLSFDAATFEIWGALLNGATLCIPNDVLSIISSADKFLLTITRNKISILWLTKTLFDNLYQQNNTIFRTIDYLLIGGEALNYYLVSNLVNSKYKPKHIINGYGPTENTTFSCTLSVNSSTLLLTDSVPIGKPLSNRQAYILNSKLIPLPIGAIGELYVSGAGLSRGYLNQPELSFDRFLTNKFKKSSNTSSDNKLYKTGDLCRYLPDGNIEYIGRNDSLIKIRGYIVDLIDIESKLNTFPGIKQSIVIDVGKEKGFDKNNKHLVGYYIADKKLDNKKILKFINQDLSNHIFLSAIIYIDKIPLNPSGKINKSLLPLPEDVSYGDYIPPASDLEYVLCRAYVQVLEILPEKIDINSDFFELGGDSILAVRLVTILQRNFKITVNDIFRLRTPSKIAKIAIFTKDNLRSKIQQVKTLYNAQKNYKESDLIIAKNKESKYLDEIQKINFVNKLKNIHNVLLTGSTGHLGCNILFQLLHTTNYIIYLPIRGVSNQIAYERLNVKFKHYFNSALDSYKNRIVIFLAYLEKPYLGLSKKYYNQLILKIDSIIHTAALVKHYGDYKLFYKTNVQVTINLLEFAKLTELKDFHYISTVGIILRGFIPNCSYYVFNEDDNGEIFTGSNNFYLDTKYYGELVVNKYREFGVNSNIYRVGNLSMTSKNYKNQVNIEENAFFHRVKTILNFGMMPVELAEVEISPVDHTALAIVKLFNQSELSNQTYHVFNPHTANLFDLFIKCKNINIKKVSLYEFLKTILSYIETKIDNYTIELFMLHQGWLNESHLDKLTRVSIIQNKTEHILKKLDFLWSPVTSKMLSDIISQSFKGINKMIEQEQIFKHLDFIAQMVPAPFYWLDLQGRFIGLNNKVLEAVGVTDKKEVLGKSVYELYKNEDVADKLQRDIENVIMTGKSSHLEDKIIDVSTGRFRYYMATRSPIFNDKGDVIAVVGTSIETTAEKEAERLELENKGHEASREQEEKFRKIVSQVVHDLGSPLAALNMVLPECEIEPAKNRDVINLAITRIRDVTTNLLNQFRPKEEDNTDSNQKSNGPILISIEILELITEKKYEYSKVSVDFKVHITPSGYFAFINADAGAIKRMLSNLINNSVDATAGKAGEVIVYLDAVDNKVQLIVEDNGGGIPDKVKEKILNNVKVTSGKAEGHGIGFGQIHDVIESHNGELSIETKLNEGTKITISLPLVKQPSWVSNSINLTPMDLIVILDYDPSIHGAWAARLDKLAPNIKRKHFEQGKEAVEFINQLTEDQKEKLFLLTDYELLKQDLHGLDVVSQTKVKRSVLVTSHYNNQSIRDLAKLMNTRILPKPLAADVPIFISDQLPDEQYIVDDQEAIAPTDLVIIDDDHHLLDVLVKYVLKNKSVDSYTEPQSFLDTYTKYPKHTNIVIAHQFNNHELSGFEIIEKLHENGFSNLYLHVGNDFDSDNLPSYIHIVEKSDPDSLRGLSAK